MSAITVDVKRNELKDWEAILHGPGGSISLYCGSSGNKAQDMADNLVKTFATGVKTSGAETVRLDGKWIVRIYDVVIKDFGSHANKAADFADQINIALFPVEQKRLAAEE